MSGLCKPQLVLRILALDRIRDGLGAGTHDAQVQVPCSCAFNGYQGHSTDTYSTYTTLSSFHSHSHHKPLPKCHIPSQSEGGVRYLASGVPCHLHILLTTANRTFLPIYGVPSVDLGAVPTINTIVTAASAVNGQNGFSEVGQRSKCPK